MFKKTKKIVVLCLLATLSLSLVACKSKEDKAKEDQQKITKLSKEINDFNKDVSESSSYLETIDIREKQLQKLEKEKYKFYDEKMNEGLEKYIAVQKENFESNKSFVINNALTKDSDLTPEGFDQYLKDTKDVYYKRMKVTSELNDKYKFKIASKEVESSKKIVDAFENTKTYKIGQEARTNMVGMKVYSVVHDTENSNMVGGKNLYTADLELINTYMGSNGNLIDGRQRVPGYVLSAKDDKGREMYIDDLQYHGMIPTLKGGERARLKFAVSTENKDVKAVKFTLNPYTYPVNIYAPVSK